MIKWIKNRLSKEAPADEVDDTPDEVEEDFNPVGVRLKPPVAVSSKPADTYIDGYNVNEAGIGADDEYSTTVNNIKTTGVDPYDTGFIDPSNAEKSAPEK